MADSPLQSPFEKVRWIWQNGKLVEFEKATVHVLSHALHYGSGVFEGIRCYETPQGPAVFRLEDHARRLVISAKMYRMEIPWPQAEIEEAILHTIRANELHQCYIRPLVIRGFSPLGLGVNPLRSPVEVIIATWPWGKYLGAEALERGVDVCVSTWTRPAPNSLPSMAKATGNYLNGQLIKMEAVSNGFAEGIALDGQGYVSEGSGENVFLVSRGVLYTPPMSASLLPGITRHSVMTLARDLGLEVREQAIPRGMLYACDELFFVGTAAEITPIRSVDKIAVGAGKPGEITRRLLKDYLAIAEGRVADRHGWLTHVAPAPAPAPVAVEQGVS